MKFKEVVSVGNVFIGAVAIAVWLSNGDTGLLALGLINFILAKMIWDEMANTTGMVIVSKRDLILILNAQGPIQGEATKRLKEVLGEEIV